MASIGGSELFIVQTSLHLPVLEIFRGIEVVEGRLLSFENDLLCADAFQEQHQLALTLS